MASHPPPPKTPHRQIRASYDEETVTVYQAYSQAIAGPAVQEQRLSASPAFSHARMTWIKPSWAWMMYRCGYSYKDRGQERVLAIRMKHEHFMRLLSQAVVCHGQTLSAEERGKGVRVQWDPERTPSLDVLPYRSIQIGIAGKVSKVWAEEWIVGIDDVTERARRLREVVEKEGGVKLVELVEGGLVPEERVYDVPEDLMKVLQMEE
ncbi:hypothetical protein HO173_005401 [Letharia columbiana]|uniref:ATP-dependent RNA helicase DHX8 n=1 Tax=Letharia columbiana TaxID=112416 RepID=A0A8H6FXL1_9LECA|nr:uncharacterized protein HO173_005401 [Letharia columbiana]KAF6236620.1 hypothetical protein HO173_005401 [Letharia columbiana]